MRGRRKAERRVSGRVLYVGAEGLRLPVWKLSSHPPIHVSSGAWELLSTSVGEAGDALLQGMEVHADSRKRTGSVLWG